jgi:hypothetical protein
MELEAILMVADALADAETGVNVKLPRVPIDARHAGLVLPPVTIATQVDDGWVARKLVQVNGHAGAFPAVAVSLATPANLAGEIFNTVHRQGELQLLIEYVQLAADSAAGAAVALYTKRAILAALAAFHSDDARRTRNQVSLLICTSIQSAPVLAERQDVITTAALQVTYQVRDHNPFLS